MNNDFTRPLYPAFLDLAERLVVIIGGGTQAEAQVRSVLSYGADVHIIAPLVTPGIDRLVAEGLVTHEERGYVRGDLAGAFIVVCATDSVEVDRAVYQEAEGQGCLVTVVGAPELSNFIIPQTVSRGPLQVAVSTAGVAPTVVAGIIGQFEQEYGVEWERYILLVGHLKQILHEEFPSQAAVHREVLATVDDSDLFERVLAGEDVTPEEVFLEFVHGREPQA